MTDPREGRTVSSLDGPPDASVVAPCHLNVLGPVTVRGHASAGAAASIVTQERQRALLCYLVLARPRGLQSRETIGRLLWPDVDPQRARRGLRNALYGLRQVLGSHVLVSVGEELVGVAPNTVACDALELERGTLDLGTPDLTHCEPFDGLRIDDAPGFMTWLQAERARLRGLLMAPRVKDGVAASMVASLPPAPHAPDPAVHYLRGHYLFLRAAHGGAPGDLDQCRQQFERALLLDPGYALALAGLSNYYAVAARRGPHGAFRATFARALDYARRAGAIDHRLAIPHVHFAVSAQYLEGDWERAGREFATAAAKEPDYAEGRRFYGVWLSQMGRDADALVQMEAAAMLEPDIPHILNSLAAARSTCGDTAGAEEALRRSLAIDPRHMPARQRLIRLLEVTERWEDACVERCRAPMLPGGEVFAAAWAANGAEGYRSALRQAWMAEAQTIEAMLLEAPEPSTNDLFAPPVVRLVSLLVMLGDTRRARSWQLQACASEPVMARWFATVPGLKG